MGKWFYWNKSLLKRRINWRDCRMTSQNISKCFAATLNVAVGKGLAGNEYGRGVSDNDCLVVDAIQSQVLQDFVGKMQETRKLERNQLFILQGECEVEKAKLVRAGIYRGNGRRAEMLSI
jgi:hypothetical protein